MSSLTFLLAGVKWPCSVWSGLALVSELTNHHEAQQPRPWQVSDAPADYTAQLLQHIVGIELTIHRLQGKWKVSQNQPEANQRSVIAGLQGQGTEGSVRMAGMVAGRGAKPSARQTT